MCYYKTHFSSAEQPLEWLPLDFCLLKSSQCIYLNFLVSTSWVLSWFQIIGKFINFTMFWLKPVRKHLYKTKCDTWCKTHHLLHSIHSFNANHFILFKQVEMLLYCCLFPVDAKFSDQSILQTNGCTRHKRSGIMARSRIWKTEEIIKGVESGWCFYVLDRGMSNIFIIYTITTATKMSRKKKKRY